MKIVLFFFFALYSIILQGQTVVATSGGTLTNANGSMSYTIGEGVANTLSNGNKAITQGFQQTYLTVSTLTEIIDLGYTITAFPNPVPETLTLKIDKKNVLGLSYALYDNMGKLIIQNEIENSETKINVKQLRPGVYLAVVRDNKQEIKTFKIIKQ